MMSSRHEISNFNVADVSVMLAVRLMLSSAISALFLSYYRLPTRPELRERDPRLSLGNLGLGTESAVRLWVDFEVLFLTLQATSGAPWALGERENMWFGQQDLQRLCECDENGKNRNLRGPMGLQEVENFQFLKFFIF